MSAPAHTTLSVQQFWTKNSMTPMPHPLHSPNLTLSNFFFCLFSWMKKVLKGKHFADVEEVKQNLVEELKGIKIHEFRHCVEQLKNCLDRCMHPMESR